MMQKWVVLEGKEKERRVKHPKIMQEMINFNIMMLILSAIAGMHSLAGPTAGIFLARQNWGGVWLRQGRCYFAQKKIEIFRGVASILFRRGNIFGGRPRGESGGTPENCRKFAQNFLKWKMHYFSLFYTKLNKTCVNFSSDWTKNTNCWECFEKIL